jgi:signal transduction histidine kinase/CheY-like chemotaxis protein
MAPHRPASAEPAPAAGEALRQRVVHAQVGLLFRNARLTSVTATPAACLFAWVFWDWGSHARLLAWCACMALVTLARIAQGAWYRRSLAADAIAWRRHFALLSTLEGLAWSAIGTWLVPTMDAGAERALALATLTGVISIGALVLQPSFAINLAFVVATLLPAIAMQFAQGDVVGTYAGCALAIYMGLIALESFKADKRIIELLTLRFEMAVLFEQRTDALQLAEERSRAKSRFLATMSHEMRTPLHAILGLTRLLREADAHPVPTTAATQLEAGESHALIEQAGEHLLTLIDDVLDFARLEAGQLRLAQAPFDLAALVRTLAALAAPAAAQAGLEVQVAVHVREPLWLHGDARRIRQILHNLVGNAIKFTRAGNIRIELQALPGPGARVEVHDTGIGIEEGELDKVFESFYQVEGAFDRRFGGAGLGLSISRELAHAMGGELSGASEPGGGSCFVLDLPLPAADAPPPPPPQDTAAAAARLHRLAGTVLLADDNPVSALVVQATLVQLGLCVRTAADGNEAVAAFKAARPDLVLMDCQMPHLDGFEATRAIRDHERQHGLPACVIVALTANAFDTDRERSLASGMDAHLTKPFRPENLVELLRRYLPAASDEDSPRASS